MIATVIILLVIKSFSCSEGSIFFPLSSVRVTLPSPSSEVHTLPPLVELSLLRDVPDHLSGADSKPNFLLKEPDDLFYIKGHDLRLREDLFNITYLSAEYQLTIEGYLGEEGPAFMNVTVFWSSSPVDCSLLKEEICFWNESTWQLAENLDQATLGALSSPLLASLCPQFAVTYDVVNCKNCDWVEVIRKDNGKGAWSLALTDRLDHEKGPTANTILQCYVSSDQNRYFYKKSLTVTVLDIDDTLPSVKFESENFTDTFIPKGSTLASGIIEDKDDPNSNKIVVTVTNDPKWPKNVTCRESFHSFTLLTCDVISLTDYNLTENSDFYVIATDQSLVTGYGPKMARFRVTLEAVQPRVLESLAAPLPGYDPVAILLPARSNKWTRVATPTHPERARGAIFHLDSENFKITENEGIVYVSKGTGLVEGSHFKLNISWTDGRRQDGHIGHQDLVVKIIAGLGGACDQTPGKKPKTRIGWCAEKGSADECQANCGLGLRLTTKRGGCHWKEQFKAPSGRNYSTCTSEPATCPDRRCDALEQLEPSICPQDCTRKVIGAGSSGNGTGILDGGGICKWDREGNTIQCGTPHIDTVPTVIPADETSCDERCQLGIGIMCFIVAIAVTTITWLTCKFRSVKKRCPARPAKEELVNMNYEECLRRPLQEAEPPARPDYFDAKWEFPRHRLTIEETVGEGEFGKVLKARADGIQGHNGALVVAVKTLKTGAKESELEDLVSELQLLKDVDHPNIIKLLGACTIEDGPLYVIIEYAEHGSLRSYLKKHRQPAVVTEKDDSCYLEGVTPLTPKRILTFAWHIAKGMAYLTDMKLVHRDLAARNVLLSKDLVCKISDFGLTRDIYEDDTYLKRSKGRVPIKWMALESLADHVYTSKSDVWSFGVLLWELVTKGSSPYPGVAAQNLYNLLQDGYRMERPPGCSPELYAIMRACWATQPSQRPSFASLVHHLDKMLSAGREYLDLGPNAVENRQYMEGVGPQWRFAGYDHPRAPCACPPGKCPHAATVRYENELMPELWLECDNNVDDEGDKTDISNITKVTYIT